MVRCSSHVDPTGDQIGKRPPPLTHISVIELIAHERVISGTSLKNDFKRFSELLVLICQQLHGAAPRNRQTKLDLVQWLDKVSFQLQTLVLEYGAKSALQLHALALEREALASTEASIEAQMETTASECATLRLALGQARASRRYLEQYEALATNISTYPSREDLERGHDQLEMAVAESRRERDDVTSTLELRTKQFGLLLRTLMDLRHTLVEDMSRGEPHLLIHQEEGEVDMDSSTK